MNLDELDEICRSFLQNQENNAEAEEIINELSQDQALMAHIESYVDVYKKPPGFFIWILQRLINSDEQKTEIKTLKQ